MAETLEQYADRVVEKEEVISAIDDAIDTADYGIFISEQDGYISWAKWGIGDTGASDVLGVVSAELIRKRKAANDKR